MVTCDEVAKNTLKFQAGCLGTQTTCCTAPVNSQERNYEITIFFSPNSFSPLAIPFSLFSNLMPHFDVETWERVFKPQLIN
jgi:hypothetical protein